MRHLAALIFLFWPAAASACVADNNEAPLFVCETGSAGKYIEICAVETEAGQSWSNVQYRFGNDEKTELVYSADAMDGAKKLFFSHVRGKNSYTVNVRFKNGDFTYRVYSVARWEGDEAPAEAMDGEAGVEVKDKKGKQVAVIECIERPMIFPEYLRRALACDADNPYGAKGCAEVPPRER
ncbi:hypothetical protein G5V57_32940 [Nordella sp. HKS 07]|uniref:hypothetical protein n=1 Tax=Nordella sp. HKS 07 TaxID=2712222 RepID=UPI0013E1CD47|nr:hypothetical protein [Nordella sp. HKS 07]QIG52087.1 hypothetical protein G5V57_32940 [Nordella sp. HKS 07]